MLAIRLDKELEQELDLLAKTGFGDAHKIITFYSSTCSKSSALPKFLITPYRNTNRRLRDA